MLASVILDIPTQALDTPYTYRVPDDEMFPRALIDRADELFDQAEALAVGEEACCIPVYYYATTWICVPEISGVTQYPTGEKLFMMATK